MDLVTHLRAFVAVAETGGFTRAAEVCACPQPVISRRVAALERRFGRLFTRAARASELTDLGRELLPHAADLVIRADHLQTLAQDHVTTVTVGTPMRADPRALVSTRTAATAAGWSVTFLEADPAARAEAHQRGQSQLTLVACPRDESQMEADLGAGTVGAGEAALPGRSVHLDQLRRPRGRPDGAGRILHLDPEDDVPYVRDPVRRAARDAGLMPGQLVVTPSVTHAVTDALERGDVLLCTETTARTAGLRWRRLSGVSVVRAYRLVAGPAAPTSAHTLRAAILGPLARAVGMRVEDDRPSTGWTTREPL